MTARAGNYYPLRSAALASSKQGKRSGLVGNYYTLRVGAPYKNQGWYAAGGVYETWISYGAPITTPPSGHTLTQLQHTPLQVDSGT